MDNYGNLINMHQNMSNILWKKELKYKFINVLLATLHEYLTYLFKQNRKPIW